MALIQKHYYRRHWYKNLKFDISYGAAGVFEGETVSFSETIYNNKGLSIPYINASYSQSEYLSQLDTAGNPTYYGRNRDTFFAAKHHQQIVRKSEVLCEKRGYYTIKGATLSATDLLLTSRFYKEVPIHAAITVYPREIEIDEDAIPYKLLLGDVLTKRFVLPDPFEFIGVREHQPFDNLRQINFGAWAKTGQPMSNILGHTVSQEVRIILNLSRYTDYKREGVYENALRLTAFLARKYIESGIPVNFATNGIDSITNNFGRIEKGNGKRQLEKILEVLARIDIPLSQKGLNTSHIKTFLPNFTELNDGCSVALVSSYADEIIYKWNDIAVARGVKVFWVAPCLDWEKSEYHDCVYPWEVDDA